MKGKRFACPERLLRFPTPAAVESLSASLQLSPGPFASDPETTWSDPSRIGEFIQTYEDRALDEDERFLLLSLIVTSFENSGLRSVAFDPLWHRVYEFLLEEPRLHAFTIWYWAWPAEGNSFLMTSAMRLVWEKVKEEISY